MPAIGTLTGDFTNSSVWTKGTGFSTAKASTRLDFLNAIGVTNTVSTVGWDLTGSTFSWRIPEIAGTLDFGIELRDNGGTTNYYRWASGPSGTHVWTFSKNGVAVNTITDAVVRANPCQRYRESGGTTYIDGSPDGVTWTPFTGLSTANLATLTNFQVAFVPVASSILTDNCTVQQINGTPAPAQTVLQRLATSVLSAGSWATSANALANDSAMATSTGATLNTEYPIDLGGFDFSAIPAGSTVNAIRVTAVARTANVARSQWKMEALDGTTSLGTTVLVAYKSTTDTPHLLTPTATLAQLKSATFKIRFTDKRINATANTSSLNSVLIAVDYTAPSTGTGTATGSFTWAGAAVGDAPSTGTTFHFPTDDPAWPYDITSGAAYGDPDDDLALAILFACSADATVVGAGFNMPPAGAGLQARAELWSGYPPTTQMAVGSFQTLAAGWNDLPLPATAVTTGIDYWIVARQSGTEVRYWALPNVYVSGNPRFETGPAYLTVGTANASRFSYSANSMTAGTSAPSDAWYGVTLLIEGVGVAGPNDGTSTGTITWAGSAAGKRTPKATGTGAVTWVGSAVGKATPKAGATGAIAWVGSAAGKRAPKAGASGAMSFVGTATGKATPKGTGTGTIAWSGAASGVKPTVGLKYGTSTGAVSFVGSASGVKPVVGVNDGTSTGAVTWSGTAVGRRTPKATTTGTVTFSGTAAGARPLRGSTAGALTFTGAATGRRVPKATANSTITWVGAGTGQRFARATVSGAITWAWPMPVGVRRPVGLALVDIDWAATAVGRAPIPLDLSRPKMASRFAEFADDDRVGVLAGIDTVAEFAAGTTDARFAGIGTVAAFVSGPQITAEFVERG
jgi:hypothetical protein